MRFRLIPLATVYLLAGATLLSAADVPDFNAQVLPVFRKYCNGCHNAKDAEGGLVLEDYTRAIKGGDNGVCIIGGQRDRSELWRRLNAHDETQMPPKGKSRPQPADLAVIQSWIDAGAKAPEGGLAAVGLVTPKIKPTGTVRAAISSVAISPNGQWMAMARPHSIEVRDLNRKGADTIDLTGHSGTINEVSFSHDGKWLCVAAGESGLIGEATLWQISDWSRGPVFRGHRDALYSAQLSTDGKLLATASYDRELITWDVASASPLHVFRGHNDAIYGVSFSPNGKLLASASGDRTVKLWDVATGQRLDTFSQPAKEQTTVAFSPRGDMVAAGGVDCRVRVWQISDSASEGTNPILYARFAHEGPILKLVFSPDGSLLASSSEDRRIKLWETKTFTQVAVLERQSDWACALAFTADNRQLVVGRMNGEYHSYAIDPNWINAATDLQRLDESLRAPEFVPSITVPVTAEVEPNDSPATAAAVTLPCIVNGALNGKGADVDFYRIVAKRGERFVIETNAQRSGSLADTKVDVLYSDGRPVLRALLQAVRDSWVNFRPIDSSSPDVRVENWEEMDLDQYLYLSGEVCKLFRAPRGPDSGFVLYSSEGKRRGYFDTSAIGHTKDEPVYIVEAFAPKSRIVDNGLPVFPLYFTNDDDADRKLGKDSRLTFTAPEDGAYLVKVSDVRGFSGDQFSYSLSVRRPRPDFTLKVATMNPKVPAGSGQRLKFVVDRSDGFDGEIRIDVAGLPKGFEASSPLVIQSGMLDTAGVLTAAKDAVEPTKEDWERITVLGTANIDGRLVTKPAGGIGELKLEKPPLIRVKLVPDEPRHTAADGGLVMAPGTTITAKIIVERNGHDDDVRFDVDDLPHGIIVDNIGLSGVLVRKQETERQIFLTARPWVTETDRMIHAVAQSVGNQASPAIRLSVRRGALVADR